MAQQTSSWLRSEVHGKNLPFLFFSMILHFFLSQPLQGQNLKKIYGTQKWQKTMENFHWDIREHRKISVDRLCSFGIYYLISSAWASSIFEKSLYLFTILILIILEKSWFLFNAENQIDLSGQKFFAYSMNTYLKTWTMN